MCLSHFFKEDWAWGAADKVDGWAAVSIEAAAVGDAAEFVVSDEAALRNAAEFLVGQAVIHGKLTILINKFQNAVTRIAEASDRKSVV